MTNLRVCFVESHDPPSYSRRPPHQAERAPVMGKKKKKKQAEVKEEEEDFNAMLKEFKQDDAKEGRHATEPPPGPVCTRTFSWAGVREL